MSSKRWLAACTGVQARDSAQKSPDFAPTLRDSVFADARSGAVCVVANPRNSRAIAAVSRLACHPANPLSRREEIVNTFYNFCAWARIWATTRSKTRQKAASCVVAKLMRMQVLEPRLAWNMAPGAIM